MMDETTAFNHWREKHFPYEPLRTIPALREVWNEAVAWGRAQPPDSAEERSPTCECYRDARGLHPCKAMADFIARDSYPESYYHLCSAFNLRLAAPL